jgi:hypothetical protein
MNGEQDCRRRRRRCAQSELNLPGRGRIKWSEVQMSTKMTIVKSPPVAPELAPFGPPPLIEGEDSAAYDELLARVSTAVKPADTLEDIWVRDVVDLAWDVFRLRRLKANLVGATAVNRMLASAARPKMDTSTEQAFDRHLDQIECIDRMTSRTEARRNAALREIELHRATLACRLRRTVQQVEDGEYRAIDVDPPEPKSAA